VQLLVEKNKNLDFKEALELAADVQPIKINPQVIDEVSQSIPIV
jgi:glycyl-tRNA synthetase